MAGRSFIQQRRAWLVLGTLALALTGAWITSDAATLDTRLLASGLSDPVYATAPLADGRLFVVEKGGTIQVVQGGVASSFLGIPVGTDGERGLLGLAFDPGYGNAASAGYRRFFVDYIDAGTGETVIASYRTSANPALADTSTRTEVLRFAQPDESNHKGGWLGFKPGDANHLFIATGDGGSSNDPQNNAQNKNVLLGKMLRIDINNLDPNLNYGVPTDNPFFGAADARGEIFAYGLRNPWRNGFDRLNGNLWIGDVGQGAREEIDLIVAASTGGQNFGWRIREGDIATPGIPAPVPPVSGLVDPLLAYDLGSSQAITGGYVVRDASSPLYGQYVFADYVTGRIWALGADGSPKTLADATELTAALDAGAGGALGNISSFGEGPTGELYIVDLAGRVVQVVPEPATVMLLLGGVALLAFKRWRAASAGLALA